MSDDGPSGLRAEIVNEAQRIGMEMVRIAPASRWDEHPLQDPDYRPRSILPWAESVIVMAVPLFIPMLATSPSMVYQELYNTTNRILDDAAYRMALFLTRKGYRAAFFPRDGYSSIDVLLRDPTAAFSQVLAAYYSGMGTIGDSHNIITEEYGPRVRMVSVVTDAVIEPDGMLSEDLCIHCGRCLRGCPAHAFSDRGERPYRMNYDACTRHHMELRDSHHWPCGTCIKVCPVGNDTRLYRKVQPVTPEGAEHCARKGSRPLPLPSAPGAEILSWRHRGEALLAVPLGMRYGPPPAVHRGGPHVHHEHHADRQDDVERHGEQLPSRGIQIERRVQRDPHDHEEQPYQRDSQAEPREGCVVHGTSIGGLYLIPTGASLIGPAGSRSPACPPRTPSP